MLRPGSLAFIVLLGALTALNALSIDMSLPAMPELARVFHATTDETQWTLSGFLMGFSAGQLFCGPLADRFGRRPLIITGLTIFVLAVFGCAASTSMAELVAFRSIQGVGACVGPILGRAMVRDLYDRDRGARMLSHMTVVMSVAPLLAPILGGYLLRFVSWRAIFGTIGLVGLAVFVTVIRRLGESLVMPDPMALRPSRILGNYRYFFTSRAALGFAAICCLQFCGLFSYISGAPFVYIEVFGVPSDNFGYFFAIPAIALVGGGLANARLLRHWQGERLIQAGLVLILAAGILMWSGALLGIGIFGIVLPIMLYVFGLGLVTPNALAAAMEPHPSMAGTVSSLIGCLQMAGGALAGWIANSFYDRTPLPMATAVLAAAAGSFLIYHLFVRGRPERAVRQVS
jgi:MFS transporter, DHA1 family, multidrug resistance protein